MATRTPVQPEEAQAVAARLDRAAILRTLAPELKAKLAHHLSWVDLEPAEVLFRSGDPGDALYLVDSGEVSIFLDDEELGLTFELSRLNAGQAFGEMALITGDVRSASVSAVVQTRLIEVSRKLFFKLVQTAPQVGLAIASALARRIDEQNRDQRVRFGTLRGVDFDAELLDMVPLRLVHRFRMVPIEVSEGVVTVATPEPYNRVGLDEIRRVLRGFQLRVMAVAESDFSRFMRNQVQRSQETTVDSREALRSAVQRRVREVKWDASQGAGPRRVDETQAQMNTRALSDLVDSIIVEGLERDASDIHIEPERTGVRVRYRVDGRMIIRDGTIPGNLLSPILSRIKVLAGVDITERRLPQDGRISMHIGSEQFDLRVATVAARGGEKVSLRVMDSHRLTQDLSALILDQETLELARRLVFQNSGLVLVTGPSGSGKTTTLYNAIGERNVPEVSIAAVENPVEYDLAGITQVQTNDAIGLTFPAVIQAFLRQSPDVIMVGETRDRATADLVGNAALTGHMVLSSFHTNDSLGALARLADMDVEPFVMANALLGVINQRLVRRICEHCRRPVEVPDGVHLAMKRAGMRLRPETQLYTGSGCQHCAGEGFKGRVGLYEVLAVGSALRDVIAREGDAVEHREAARDGEYITLATYGARLLAAGITTPTEVLRVLPMQHGD